MKARTRSHTSITPKRRRENLHFVIKIKTGDFLFLFPQSFLKQIENTFFEFLPSYRNTRGSLGELRKVVNTIGPRLVSLQHFSFFQTCTHDSVTRYKPRKGFLFLKYHIPINSFPRSLIFKRGETLVG